MPSEQTVYESSSNNTSMTRALYNTFFWVATILLFYSFGAKDETSITCSIVGYSTLELGILLFVIDLFIRMNNNQSSSSIVSIIFTILPFLIILGSIGYIIYLISVNKIPISKGDVAPGYYSFVQVLLILIGMQFFAFNYMVDDKTKNNFVTLPLSKSLVLLIFSWFIILTVVTIHIILTYFTTDG